MTNTRILELARWQTANCEMYKGLSKLKHKDQSAFQENSERTLSSKFAYI